MTFNPEDVILQLAREFVGEGIDLYENLEELEELFYANNLEYMSLGEFINLLQKYNYHFYKDYVVRGKASYGLLCMNIIQMELNLVRVLESMDRIWKI